MCGQGDAREALGRFEMNSKNFATLVCSSDNYSDLWDVFFESFFRHNPNFAAGRLYLGANQLKYGDPRVKTVLSGPDIDWESSYRKILEKIKEDYIFVVQEDMVIVSEIDQSIVAQCFELLRSGKALYIHDKHPLQHPRRAVDSLFGIYDRGMPYRITYTGFWNRKYLLSLLLPGESGWNFEKMGSYRSAYNDGIYYLKKELYKKVHLVAKRKWRRQALKEAAAHGLRIDMTKRSIISGWEVIPDFIRDSYFNVVIRINWKWRLRVMDLMRKLLACY